MDTVALGLALLGSCYVIPFHIQQCQWRHYVTDTGVPVKKFGKYGQNLVIHIDIRKWRKCNNVYIDWVWLTYMYSYTRRWWIKTCYTTQWPKKVRKYTNICVHIENHLAYKGLILGVEYLNPHYIKWPNLPSPIRQYFPIYILRTIAAWWHERDDFFHQVSPWILSTPPLAEHHRNV